jgi:hypothetical protein
VRLNSGRTTVSKNKVFSEYQFPANSDNADEAPNKSPEAKKPKFKKVIDQEMTLRTLRVNKSLFDFLSAELHPDKTSTFSQILIRQNGFIYIFRIIFFHLVLVTNQNLPQFWCLLILALELVYSSCNIQKYLKSKHLKTRTLFFAKIS